MRNVHEREIDAPAAAVGAMLDRLGQGDDVLWPSPRWQPMVLDRPMGVGADGGHGPVRYRVVAHDPGRRVRLELHPELGLEAYHEFTVEPAGAERCVVRHVLQGRTRGAMRLLFPLVVRWLHDATLEDLLDATEQAAAGHVERPARWSPWVRLWWHLTEVPRPRAVPVPEAAQLARAAFAAPDFVDAWQVARWRGLPDDPQVWASAIFGWRPRWVDVLLRLRNLLVPIVGIERGDEDSFATVARDGSEVLLGTDAGHLDFRASVLVDDDAVTVTTVVATHGRRGRLYMRVVSLVHPAIVRAMLRRAARELARAGSSPERLPAASRLGHHDDPPVASPERAVPRAEPAG